MLLRLLQRFIWLPVVAVGLFPVVDIYLRVTAPHTVNTHSPHSYLTLFCTYTDGSTTPFGFDVYSLRCGSFAVARYAVTTLPFVAILPVHYPVVRFVVLPTPIYTFPHLTPFPFPPPVYRPTPGCYAHARYLHRTFTIYADNTYLPHICRLVTFGYGYITHLLTV